MNRVEQLEQILQRINDLVWGPWLLCFLMGTGIYLMICLKGLPIRKLWFGFRCAFEHKESAKEGEISPFSAFMTELAATIGTGNIVGVATAMVLGGPGALVWMLLSSMVGLALKFSESMLSVKYREKNAAGEWSGGPMYTLKKAFPNKRMGNILAICYAICAVFASFGMGNMTQSHSIASTLQETWEVDPAFSGMVVSILTILIVMGGIKAVGKLNRFLVPVMAIGYLAGALVVILVNRDRLVESLSLILQMAFSVNVTDAIAGGLCGSITVSGIQAVRWGISRGVFSNEAGLGASGISAASAYTDDPVRQGYISMVGVFIDTVVICTVTGLAIVTSGALGSIDETGKLLTGTELTTKAFETVFGKNGAAFVSVGMVLFAFATIVGWFYQGEKAFEFIFRKQSARVWFRFVYGLVCFAGAVGTMQIVWSFSDLCNGLMAIPNLICLLALSKEMKCVTGKV